MVYVMSSSCIAYTRVRGLHNLKIISVHLKYILAVHGMSCTLLVKCTVNF